MNVPISRHQFAAIVLALVVLVSGVGAYTALFTGGAGTAYETPSGLVVGTNVDQDVAQDNPYNGTDTVYVDGVSFTASGPANVTVDQFSGTYTNVSAVDASTNDITIDPDDKPQATVGGSVTKLSFRDTMSLADDKQAFVYSASGSGTVTVNGLAANTDFTAATASGTQLDSGTTDGSGSATISVSSATDASVILYTNTAPTVDNDAASPDGANLDSESVTLEIPVNDTDFSSTQGDSVDVEFQANGPADGSFSSVGTETLSDNGTANATFTASEGGTWQWRAVATDASGDFTTSDTFTFEVPATLYIRNETNTSQLVDSPVTTEVRFFGEDQIYSRNASDGTINMTGLPVDQPFIVEVDASEDYRSRTVYIKDIYSQQTVYLLSQNETSVESRFVLDDPTGEYGPESVLFVEKPIERNGTVTYQTVYADRFGVEGVTADLEQGARYRLAIQTAGGTVQDVGPYRADVSETVNVRPGPPSVDLSPGEDGWGSDATLSNRTLEYGYTDPQNETVSLTVFVHEKGNTSNQLGTNRTYANLGEVTGTYTLTGNESDKTWVVNFIFDRGGGEQTAQVTVANQPNLVPDLSDEWRLIGAIAMLFISAGVFSVLNAGVGGVIVAVEGGILWWTGWLSGATTGAAVVIALFIAVLAHMYSRG